MDIFKGISIVALVIAVLAVGVAASGGGGQLTGTVNQLVRTVNNLAAEVEELEAAVEGAPAQGAGGQVPADVAQKAERALNLATRNYLHMQLTRIIDEVGEVREGIAERDADGIRDGPEDVAGLAENTQWPDAATKEAAENLEKLALDLLKLLDANNIDGINARMGELDNARRLLSTRVSAWATAAGVPP
ncbi:MAG: hypothetical protein HYY67_03605 [Thaumarchaeota archaeon]|nr:hypothetical protein [Nitrososphaerota archaeon]